MVRIRSTILFATLSVAVLILVYTTFQNLLSSYAEAQNSTTQNITQSIPTTISKEAQEELQKVPFDPSLIKSPDPTDLKGWKEQYNNFESISAEFSRPIVELLSTQYNRRKVGRTSHSRY